MSKGENGRGGRGLTTPSAYALLRRDTPPPLAGNLFALYNLRSPPSRG
ncbi:MAG: hypothetical protein LBB23_02280 [Rickettsiales bacterium]|nr:hypothetical protein [Rickettsiales bacterium]